ncbi:MAG: hypothetical protein ABFS12_14780 [Bacteroidota bacterium]
MKKLIYLLILSLFIFTNCEQVDEIIDLTSFELKGPPIDIKGPETVPICSLNKKTGEWQTLYVPKKFYEVNKDKMVNTYPGDCDDYPILPPVEVILSKK